MGYLYKSSPTIFNSSKATFSVWFQTKSNASVRAETLISIRANPDNNYQYFELTYNFATISPLGIVPSLILNTGNADGWHGNWPFVYLRDISSVEGPGGPWIDGSNYSTAGQWMHYICSVDWSLYDASNAAYGVGWEVLNGVAIRGSGFGGFLGATPENITFSGCQIGVPSLVDHYDPSGPPPTQTTPTVLGDFQFWAGIAPDVTSPSVFNKFVSVSGGHGTPVDPAIAAAAFGQQTILFKGDHTHFPNNLGTAGAFTLVGTDVDFTPTPSYG
jgi:hypothetical protein